jgi:hypothetical protein
MELTAFDKLVMTLFGEQINAKVIGVKPEPDGSNTYIIQSLLKDFTPSKTGGKLMRINSKEIENQTVNIQKHTI